MSTSAAKVSSVEALEAFRANLIIYLSKARPTLEEAGADVLRTRLWLQSEQRVRCEGEVRRRAQALEQAQQDLFSAGLADLRSVTSAEQAAVHKAKHALEQAEQKLSTVKRWNRDFESRVSPLAKQLDRLENILAQDLPKAIAYLATVVKTLEAYAGTKPAPAEAAPPDSAPASTPEGS